MITSSRVAWALLSLLVAGCSSESPAASSTAASSGSTATTTGAGGASTTSTSTTSAGGAGGHGGDTGPKPIPPLAPASTPEPIVVPSWKTCTVPASAKEDEVLAELEAGTFTMPAGARPDCQWKTLASKEGGGLGKPPAGVLYAAAEIDAKDHVFIRPDLVVGVYGDRGELSPGDLYGSGKLRVPVVAGPGKRVVVVRALGGRGEPSVELWSTPHELVFNTSDLTAPDLVEGDTSEQPVGVAVLDVGDRDAIDLAARVEESDLLEATTTRLPGLPAGATTQVAFRLAPKGAWPAAGTTIKVGLRLESTSLTWSYRTEIELVTVAKGATHKRTFVSPMDGSAQYYGVVPPTGFDPAQTYALVLSLHGAGVEAIGQAQAYSPKDWAFLVAATNRRPFGFDWEEFGRRDGIEVLEDAQKSFPTAPDRVHLTGHSMGGHGTWQLGVLFPGRFATIGPSAGWGSYTSYVGMAKPTGAFARSQASSDTFAYLSNLARRGVYAIHGSADDNVPIAQAEMLLDALKPFASDVVFHVQEGAGHWWDGDASPGADCVDWPPLFDFMKAHVLDPFELDFDFVTPSPFVNPRHAYATILSQATAMQDSRLVSSRDGDTVTLATTNVRALRLDGDALAAAGVATIVVDGAPKAVAKGPIAIGPATGKTTGRNGPFDEVFARPFCLVVGDDAPPAYARYAAFLLSLWSTRGNGRGCALPLSAVTADVRASYDLVYLGVPPASIGVKTPGTWGGATVGLGADTVDHAAIAFVFPEGDRLSAVIAATPGDERLLYRFQPFRSAWAAPDYLVWTKDGAKLSGFFDAEWAYVPPK